MKQEGKSERNSKKEKALHNITWNVTSVNMRKNELMFELDIHGNPHAKTVEVYMDSADLITDPTRLIDIDFESIPIVKSVTNTCPWNPKVDVLDLKLDVLGPKEDEYYSASPNLI